VAQRQPVAAKTNPTVVRGLPPGERTKSPNAVAALPAPERISIVPPPPPPEQLGIGIRPAPTQPDWNATRLRLHDMGALKFNLEQPAPNAYRFTILLPTALESKTFEVEGVGATETEAMHMALDRADRWRTAR
jgi:hypothetical protein